MTERGNRRYPNRWLSSLASRRWWGGVVIALCLIGVGSVEGQSLERHVVSSVCAADRVDIHHGSDCRRVASLPSATKWPQSPSQVSGPSTWVTYGKEFYACFISAVGDNDGLASGRVHSLFISSRAPTKAIVEWIGGGFADTVFVAPGAATRVDMPDGLGLGRSDYELAMKRVVYVHSNEELAVYGFTNYFLSSDGFLIYPVESLGNDYVVASERNALNYSHGTDFVNPRSEFAVVATQDGTTVTMNLTANSYSWMMLADSTYSIVLNRGEVYQVMAHDTGVQAATGLYQPRGGGPDCDLTGSLISSDKPIAVFSGHERATSPSVLEYDPSGCTRDHLVEQMVPVSMCGTHYIVVSSGNDQKLQRRTGGDMVRVISAFDSATVTINDTSIIRLGRGNYHEFMAGNVSTITSDMPVMVAKYMQSSNGMMDSVSDPDFTLVRSIEAYQRNYTLPGAHDQAIFNEAHLLLICDTSAAYATLRNEKTLTGYPWTRIKGTAYQYSIFNSYAGEQRVKSPLPCYAEAFAFSTLDSYTYAGGGGFTYVDSLFATDLDFKTVSVGAVSDLTSPVHSSSSRIVTDTVLVYGYEWVSGDTNNFQVMTGPVGTPIRVTASQAFSIPIRFQPDARRAYSATLRVWSNAINNVLIHFKGQSASPMIRVIPDTIDFGRVRLGVRRDSFFIIEDVGNAGLDLQFIDFNRSLYGIDTEFVFDSLKGAVLGIYHLDPVTSRSVQDSVHFLPTQEGKVEVSVKIYSTDPVFGSANQPTVVLMGEGVIPRVTSSGYGFGSVRVDSLSTSDTAYIVNSGSDVAMIDTIRIVDSSTLANFTVSLDTLARTPNALPIELGYKQDTVLSYVVQYTPKALGRDTLVVFIHTTDGVSIYDKFTGMGVEPLIKVAPQVIDFGTIQIATNSIPSPQSSPFTVTSSGTMAGQLDSLVYADHTDFNVLLDKPTEILNESLAVGSSVGGTAIFNVSDEGDFLDTVFVANDTRYALYGDSVKNYVPRIILKAKVRTGPINDTVISFGTITTCDTLYQNVLLHNPYPVEVHIDSIGFAGQNGGFDFSHALPFNPQINIPPNGDFSLPLQYVFPIDSLNGTQSLVLMLFQRSGGSTLAIREFDTIYDTITLIRKQRVLTLHPHVPIFISSANDISAMRLPISVEGPRNDVPELNSFTFTLQFSNDLFVPYEIDTTGGLAIPGFPTGYKLQTHWDQATRTYTIVADSTALADQTKLGNDLLFALRMQAYLTTDTVVTVTPTFTFKNHPCNYNLQTFQLKILYADDCGDPTIRRYMLGEAMQFRIQDLWPNPISSGADGVTIDYTSSNATELRAIVTDMEGRETGRASSSIVSGGGQVNIPSSALPKSGIAFVRLEARDAGGRLIATRFTKVMIMP